MNLRDVLAKYSITQTKLAAKIFQPNGKPLSVSAMNQLIMHGRYPASTTISDIQTQITDVLGTMNIFEEIDWKQDKSQEKQFNQKKSETREEFKMEMLSSQAKELFKLDKSPFIDDVQNRDDVFLSPEQRYIRTSMLSSAKYGGFMAIIGESGAGKTTLKRDLLEGILQNKEEIIVIQPQTIDKTRLTAAHLCDAIIEDVSQGNEKPMRSMEAKARQIKRLLTASSRTGNQHCIVIDEGHDLTIPMLKYLKRFWELEDGMKKLLSIVLIGQPELRTKLSERNADIREVARRVEQVELQPLNADVGAYLAHKFRRINRNYHELFSDDAMDGLTKQLTRKNGEKIISNLYPLIVNNAVIKAMNEAAAIGQQQITADIFAGV